MTDFQSEQLDNDRMTYNFVFFYFTLTANNIKNKAEQENDELNDEEDPEIYHEIQDKVTGSKVL